MTKTIPEIENDNERQEGENLNPAEPAATPLEQVREQQGLMRENREVTQELHDTTPEVVGASIPSDRRHHPQRQMYGSGTNES